jgi:hypothetical protein
LPASRSAIASLADRLEMESSRVANDASETLS